MSPATTFTDAEFTYISDMVRTRSAIVLEPGKEYLVEARLAPLVRELGLDSIAALVARLRLPSGAVLAERVTEAMTTNETSFFRDVAPFQALRTTTLPRLVRARAALQPLTALAPEDRSFYPQRRRNLRWKLSLCVSLQRLFAESLEGADLRPFKRRMISQ